MQVTISSEQTELSGVFLVSKRYIFDWFCSTGAVTVIIDNDDHSSSHDLTLNVAGSAGNFLLERVSVSEASEIHEVQVSYVNLVYHS